MNCAICGEEYVDIKGIAFRPKCDCRKNYWISALSVDKKTMEGVRKKRRTARSKEIAQLFYQANKRY